MGSTFEDILFKQITAGENKYEQHNKSLFVSSIAAGLEVGFSFLLIMILYHLFSSQMGKAQLLITLSLAYSVGFIFVVLGKSLLFTEHTALAVMPVFNRTQKLGQLAELWIIIYFGNLIGGLIFAGVLSHLGSSMHLFTQQDLSAFLQTIINYDFLTIVVSATIAGWLMALLSWTLSASSDTISKIFIVIIVTFIIGVGHFHHCIVGFIELTTGLLNGVVTFAEFGKVQLAASIGNIIGGVLFVGIVKYSQLLGISRENFVKRNTSRK